MALLRTKLAIPTPRRRLVGRPRLTDRLPTGVDPLPRLVLVAAPAGFGKTTLLAQWLAEWRASGDGTPRRVAWLALDAGDSDPSRFASDLVAAVQEAAPEVGSGEPLPQSPTAALTALASRLEHLYGSTVLALDDYHVIESLEVHEAVAALLQHLPPSAGLAIATRADPPVPLATLRARGELLELRADALRFTRDEAEGFLNTVMGLALDKAQVDALEQRTEGWVAGLQLAALSLRDRSDADEFVDAFAGSHRFVLDYLVEEVLDRQPPPIVRFLLDTAVLDQLTAPLCDALTGGTDGQRMLESLDRAGLFVVPLDDRREWYRYHHLFADALRARVVAEEPARLRTLHAAASRWYAAHDRLEDAIRHAVAGDEPEEAASLVERALPDASRQRHDRTIQDWLRALPDEVVRRRPVLNVAAAWRRLSEGEVDEADARLGEAEAMSAGAAVTGSAVSVSLVTMRDEDRQLAMTIAMYRAAIAQARGDVDATADHARRMLDLAHPEDHLARGAGGGFLGLSLWARGELGAAVTTFAAAVRSLHAAGNLADALGATVVLGGMWLARGRPDEAGRLYERVLASAQEQPAVALPVTGDLHVGLADVLRERGERDTADQHLQAARALGDAGSLPENRHRWLVTTARMRWAEGRLDLAADLLEQAETAYRPGFFPDLRPIPALRAQVDVLRGRLDLARDWARAHAIAGVAGVGGPDELSYRTECDHLTLARLLIAEMRVEEALALLARLHAAAKASERGASLVEVLLVTALAQQADGDLDAATPTLAHALELAVPVGYRRIVLDEGEPMQRLLRETERRGLATQEVRRILGASGRDAAGDHAARTGSAAPAGLSKRELEVLRLLATELTGPEIARRLYVSVNTLRTHTKSIFTKLDVSTRRAAVQRAQDLGLE